ncbi:hypothetical protein WBG78_10215 [Chryseolinea sp. T2]|uniref:hypothetical protein n=1 Tax=Chryseolinea sp. T2 TaxID=3129255 RepID=UPI0030771894
MKRSFFVLLLLVSSTASFSQAPADAAASEPHTLGERFLYMKSKSQSYGAYKVIKESTLDGVWKIAQDSLEAKKRALAAANGGINALKNELNQKIAAVAEKEKSMAAVQYDSTHIDVMGISMLKGTLLTVVAISIAALLLFLVLVIGRMKLQANALSERNLAVSALTSEFEDYKHRAMDKQTKLSRELQDERNKLQAMIRNS